MLNNFQHRFSPSLSFPLIFLFAMFLKIARRMFVAAKKVHHRGGKINTFCEGEKHIPLSQLKKVNFFS